MPKAFSKHEKQVIVARLLDQGSKHFVAYGLKKTSVQELAASAGISKGAFYNFFESKEALFMDVVEEAEKDFRRQVLEVIDLPSPSPRGRLIAVFRKAFTIWKTVPIMRLFTHGDYEILSRRVPPDKIREHFAADRQFIDELIARCQKAGIPIQAPADQIRRLLFALFFTSMHEDDFGSGNFTGTVDLLLELMAAFCLGEVLIQSVKEI